MRLMQYELRFTSGNGRPEVATIAELVSACRAMDPERGVPAQTADLVLRRHGIRLMEGGLRIFGHSELAKRAFAETSWAGGWAATLARAPGARRNVNTRYVEMIGGKSVVIPLDAISGSAT
jgi:hypothetical protein